MSDKPDVVKYIYKCVVCVKKEKGIENDSEAMTLIFEANGSLQYKRRQIEKCKVAQQRAVAFIEATGGTVKKPRVFKLGLSFMSDLFGGYAEMLAMKAKQYHIASLQLEGEGKAMLEKLKVSTDPVEIAKLIEWIEGKLLTDLEPLAFKGSRDHLNASAYDDTFAEFNGGHMRYFFICKAGKGYGEVCMILLSSKQWKQLFPDVPWCPGQRWYCLCCTARYRAGWGVVVEFRKGDKYYYMAAACPPEGILDIRAMMHEKHYGPAISASELYAKLPVVKPHATSLVVPHGKFMKFADRVVLDGLREFKWETIFQFASSMEQW
jgi:hypothetical protein